MYIYFGEWVWNDKNPNLKYWEAPFSEECVGILDLRSDDLCGSLGKNVGSGIFVYENPHPKAGELLGNDPNSILASQKNFIKKNLNLGENIVSNTVGGLIWEILNKQADPLGKDRLKPLMPNNKGEMELFLPPFGRIFVEKFSETKHPFVIPVFENNYKKIVDNNLDLGIDPDIESKYLSVFSKKLNKKWEDIIPEGYTKPPKSPSTTISDPFTRSNSSSLGTSPGGWTWTEFSGGNWEIISNKAGMNNAVAGANQYARANSYLSADDHYAQIEFQDVLTSGTWDSNTGVLVRKDSSSTLTFYAAEYSNNATGYWRTFKMVAGSYTAMEFQTAYDAPVSGDTLRLEVNGSSLKRYVSGVEKFSTTDTSITGNLGCGLSGYRSGNITTQVSVDNFIASDILSPIRETTFGTSLTTMTVNLPEAISSGDLLLAFVSVRNAGTWTLPSGWTEMGGQDSGGVGELSVFYKISDGTEGVSQTWTVSVSTTAVWQTRKISDWDGITPPEISFASSGGVPGSNIDPPSLTPSWGSTNTQWIAIGGAAAESITASSYPTGFSDGLWTNISAGGSSCSVGTTTLEDTASSKDPSSFTTDASRWWYSATLAVKPFSSTKTYSSSVKAYISRTQLSDNSSKSNIIETNLFNNSVKANILGPSTEGWLGSWAYRKKITIDNTNIDADLSHFPLLVKLGTSVGTGSDDVSDIFDEVGANSLKIAFTQDDGEILLYAEVEEWDSASETASIWVSGSTWTISNSTTTDIYIYFDNNQADNTTYVGNDADDTASNNVWDANYLAVFHMNQSAGTLKDSTSNSADGTFVGSLPDVARGGFIGDGQDFDGTGDHVAISVPASGNITRELFFYPDDLTNYQGLLSRGGSIWASGVCHIKGEGGNALTFDINNGTSNKLSWSVSTGSWYYLSATYNTTTGYQALYGNGALQDSATIASGTTIDQVDYIGNEYDGARDADGIIDEVRFSDTPRSASWVKATYYVNTDAVNDFSTTETLPSSSTVSSGNSSKASILTVNNYNNNSKLNIVVSNTNNNSSKGDVLVIESNNNSVKANIKATLSNDNNSKSSIVDTNKADNLSKTNIKRNYFNGSNVKASIAGFGSFQNNVKANIFRAGESNNNSAKTSIVRIESFNNNSKASIVTTKSYNNDSKANITRIGELENNNTKASIVKTSVSNNSAKASIIRTKNYENNAVANILGVTLDLLVQYNFATNTSPSMEISGITGSAVAPSVSLTTFEYPANYGYASDPTIRIVGSESGKINAVPNDQYFDITITPTALMTLRKLNFNASRGGTSTPRGVIVYSSIDSYATPILDSDVPTSRFVWTSYSIDLDSNYVDLTSPITFRFYTYADAANRSIEFDDIEILGEATAVAVGIQENHAKANIVRLGETRDNSSKASIIKTESLNNNSKSSIVVTNEYSNSVKFNIISSYSDVNNAKASILRSESKDNNVKSNIKSVYEYDSSVKASILQLSVNTQNNSSKANILNYYLKDSSSKASIVITKDDDQQSKASIVNTHSQDISSKANIKASTELKGSSKANLLRTKQSNNLTKASIVTTRTSSNETTSNILADSSYNNSVKASIVGTNQKHNNSLGNIFVSGNNYSTSSKASIVRTEDSSNQTKANVVQTNSASQSVKTNILVTNTISSSVKANIKKTQSQSNYTKASIVISNEYGNEVKASVVVSRFNDLLGKANIQVTNLRDNVSKANIKATSSYENSTKGSVASYISRHNYSKANITLIDQKNFNSVKGHIYSSRAIYIKMSFKYKDKPGIYSSSRNIYSDRNIYSKKTGIYKEKI